VDRSAARSASERIRDAVVDALRRVGPPDATPERVLTVPAGDDDGGGERT
jgi:hypothetical protein